MVTSILWLTPLPKPCATSALPYPAEKDLLQRGHTKNTNCSDCLHGRDCERKVLRALATPLVAEFGRENRPIEIWSMTPTKQEILAASAGWVDVTLNAVPGLGAGYLNQRRCKANGSHLHQERRGSPLVRFWIKQLKQKRNFRTSCLA